MILAYKNADFQGQQGFLPMNYRTNNSFWQGDYPWPKTVYPRKMSQLRQNFRYIPLPAPMPTVLLTPGSLGIRELVLGSGAVVLGVPLEVGLLAAMVDRAIALSWSFVIGGACTAWLWRKSPVDFKGPQTDASTVN